MAAKQKVVRKRVRNNHSKGKVKFSSSSGAYKLKKNSNKVVLLLFVVLAVLIIVLIALVISNFNFVKVDGNPQLFMVRDECSLVMGNLIHQIRDDGECRIKCVNECDVREMGFVRFEFEQRNDDCSVCRCYCN